MDVSDYKDAEHLVERVAHPLEHIAGALAEINANLEAIVANGAEVTLTLKIGDRNDG